MINPLVCDLSHWDPATDYGKVKAAGYVGVIFKATQGTSMTDSTYVAQRRAARAAGLHWGAYHFADSTSASRQATNFLRFASPEPDELFALDWEDNGGNKMTLTQATDWIGQVETSLNRPGQCVVYSGNTAKEALGSSRNTFLGSRRLWLAQYSSIPVVQRSWDTYWLWQFTDGQFGPPPHTVPGVGKCDINTYQGTPAQLASEWATGVPPGPVVVIPPPAPDAVKDPLTLQKALNRLGDRLAGDPLVEDGIIGARTFAKLDDLINKFGGE